MLLQDNRPEIFKNKKLAYRFLAVMGLIVAIIVFAILREGWLIDSNKVTMEVPISKREVDYKERVTIYVYFTVDGKEYRAIDVVTGIENNYHVKFLEGDTVFVDYYKENPSYNRIGFRKFDKHYSPNR